MKILHTADWHIGQFKGPVVDGVNLRSQDISEVGLYDADGDMVAMKAFLKKGKDADMECVFECDDTF